MRVNTIAAAADLEVARAGVSAWCESVPGQEGQNPPEEMLPTPLSPTGENPPTHWGCFRTNVPAELIPGMIAYRDAHQVPVTIATDVDRDEHLASLNLKVIGGP